MARLRTLNRPAMLEAIRPRLTTRLRRALDAGYSPRPCVSLLGVFRASGGHFVGFRFRSERGRYVYVKAWEERLRDTWRLHVAEYPTGFDWGDWCEDAGSDKLAAIRRLRRMLERRTGRERKHDWTAQAPRGAADIRRDALDAV